MIFMLAFCNYSLSFNVVCSWIGFRNKASKGLYHHKIKQGKIYGAGIYDLSGILNRHSGAQMA
jgi:hypothetical protein